MAVWRLCCVVHTNSCITVAILVLLRARARKQQRTLAYPRIYPPLHSHHIHTSFTQVEWEKQRHLQLHGPRVEGESEGEAKGGSRGAFGLAPGSGLELGLGLGLGLGLHTSYSLMMLTALAPLVLPPLPRIRSVAYQMMQQRSDTCRVRRRGLSFRIGQRRVADVCLMSE